MKLQDFLDANRWWLVGNKLMDVSHITNKHRGAAPKFAVIHSQNASARLLDHQAHDGCLVLVVVQNIAVSVDATRTKNTNVWSVVG